MTNQINFKREIYKNLCEEMKELIQKEKEMAFQKDIIRNQIIEMSGGDRMEYGIKVSLRNVKGGVDYKAIVEHIYQDDELKRICEDFQKPMKSYYEIKSY